MSDAQTSVTNSQPRSGLLALIGPGLLVAATGVGAGDLATGALSGQRLGLSVLWAVLLGAFIKFVLNEGLARWQLATGTTVLEGAARHFGRVATGLFFLYLCLWSFVTSSALMSACGVAGHALYPVIDRDSDRILYGILHSVAALELVLAGGYRLFEKLMSVCIGAMFLIVAATTIAMQPDWFEVLRGMLVPQLPTVRVSGGEGNALQWTIGLMGGIGGTVTVLCYGYWIREEGRSGLSELRTCRIDLMSGYLMTAVFGIGMVILGNQLAESMADAGTLSNTNLLVALAGQLQASLGEFGPAARIAFLIGAWGAVFSSMFGVWQSVPYLFADAWKLLTENSNQTPSDGQSEQPTASNSDISHSMIYRAALFAIALLPMTMLTTKFATLQLIYAVTGAAFMPILALALLFLNGSRKRIGDDGRDSIKTSAALIAIIVFFAVAGMIGVAD